MSKVKIVESPRQFETVGEEVRFNVLTELKENLLKEMVLSCDNSLTQDELSRNKACNIAIEMVTKLLK